MKRFYLDTCIWRDYFEDRSNGLKPLSEFAFQFLEYCKKENYKIIISNIVEKELLISYSKNKIELMFNNFKENIIKIDFEFKQHKEAKIIWFNFKNKYPFADIIHSIIARDSNAILITRDKHFKKINIVNSFLPEEFLYL